MPTHHTPTRRAFLAGSAGGAALWAASAAGASTEADAPASGTRAYQFEITHSDEAWRARLPREEYVILRKGSTELPHTSPLVKEARNGVYRCKGCDLDVFDSVWKEPLDIGYVFFRQSVPNAVLTDIDGKPAYGRENAGVEALLEVHCRRCGSHLGHIVPIRGKALYCINGTALGFEATTT